MKRIAGLDSIRFVCALTVLFFHYTSPPIFAALSRTTPHGRIILGLYDAAFNGQAAVIAFFVISGLCIHYPYACGRAFSTGPFLLGRFARILIPTAIYFLLLAVTNHLRATYTLPLWSVWCELAYYAAYPLLRVGFARTSTFTVLAGSFIASLILTVIVLTGSDWPALFDAGYWTVLAGLPCWLLGCVLAERISSAPAASVTARRLWMFRCGAAGFGFLSYLAMFHLHVSFLASLQVFAIFAFFWLETEVRWYREHPANRLLEILGGISFSLYLVHILAKSFWSDMVSAHGMLAWAAEIVFILTASALFFAAVEKPSHIFARRLAHTPPLPEAPLAPDLPA